MNYNNDDKQGKVIHNYNTNEVDNLYLNILSAISEYPDKIEINNLKKDIGEKYKFFTNMPLTLVLIGPKSSGKKSIIYNILNSIKTESSLELDFILNTDIDPSKKKLIVYENSYNNLYQILRKRDNDIIYLEEGDNLEEIKNKLMISHINDDYEDIVIKLPLIPFAIQILYTPFINEQTLSSIDNYLVQTSLPIFIHVCSFDHEYKIFDKQYDYLKSLVNRYLNSYFYLIMTNLDKVKDTLRTDSQIGIFTNNINNFINNIDKIRLKYIKLTAINEFRMNNKDIYSDIFKYLYDFYRNNVLVVKIEYFKCLLRSSVNKLYLVNSERKKSSLQISSNSSNLKENISTKFEEKLSEFFSALPKTKKDIKSQYSKWYETFKEIMKKNDNESLKNKMYVNRKSFMADHIQLIKPHFNTFFKEIISKLMLDCYPSIMLTTFIEELCTDVVFILDTNYQVGSFVGIWSKDGVYSDIIEKMFKRLKDNQDALMTNCKNIFEKALNSNMSHMEFISKLSDLIKDLYTIIDSQVLKNKDIEMYTPKSLLYDYFKEKEDKFPQKLIEKFKS